MKNLPHVALLLCVGSVAALSGCAQSIVYGEGTNISIATLKVNDNPATPLQITTGLNRTVAALVPRQGSDGEAMNLISSFKFKDDPHAFGKLTIDTQFVSGQAAVQLAKKHPAAASAIMNLSDVTPDAAGVVAGQNMPSLPE